MPSDNSPTDDLQAEAFELLAAYRGQASKEAEIALEAFRDQSQRHAEVLEHARLLQEIAPSLQDEKGSLWDTLWLWLDLRWVRWLEPHINWRLAAALPIALIGVVAIQLVRPTQENDVIVSGAEPALEHEPLPVEYATRWQETREFTLSDGSIAWLDWRTSISEVFGDTERHVTVHEGKAAFAVVAIPDLPFFVQAGEVTTEVTGTQFVVHFLTPSQVEVSVLEGNVKVSTSESAEVFLEAAQAVAAEGSALGQVEARATEDMGLWREGLLIYRERALTDALYELAGYTRYSLDLSRIPGSERRISGVFFKDQAEDALITVLEGQDLTFTQEANRLIVEPKAPF